MAVPREGAGEAGGVGSGLAGGDTAVDAGAVRVSRYSVRRQAGSARTS